jgi:hypothetical protein
MRITAYAMLADPSFLRESLQSYYAHVDRIVVCYDRSATSWTGTPLPVEACLEMVDEVDVDGKCVALPGDFADLNRSPLDNDTHQRQVALDAASDGADWVLQLDTDEVVPSPRVFFGALGKADAQRFAGLDFPARRLYSRVRAGRYLEYSRRFGRVAASYPGPVAVRAGTTLRLARQADVSLYRVDVRPHGTDPWYRRDAPIHEVIGVDEAVLHFSWVRTHEIMLRKFAWSGHAPEIDGPIEYRAWVRRTRRPHLAAFASTFRSSDWLRVVDIPEPPGGDPAVASEPLGAQR